MDRLVRHMLMCFKLKHQVFETWTYGGVTFYRLFGLNKNLFLVVESTSSRCLVGVSVRIHLMYFKRQR